MNDRTYKIPGLKGWTFKTSDKGYKLSVGNRGHNAEVTSSTPVSEIAERVKSVMWFGLQTSREVADEARKAVFRVDWQKMMAEAGTDIEHQSPSLPGWLLKISDSNAVLSYYGSEVVKITTNTSMREITDGIRKVLQGSSTPEEIEAVVQIFTPIDFRALILNSWVPKFAPLLDNFEVDNTDLIKSICDDVELLAILQKVKSTELVDEICTLVEKLAKLP